MHGCCHICFPKSCCGGKHALLVLLVGGWDVQLWLCERSNGVSSQLQSHWEMLGASIELDCRGSLCWLFNSKSEDWAKRVQV